MKMHWPLPSFMLGTVPVTSVYNRWSKTQARHDNAYPPNLLSTVFLFVFLPNGCSPNAGRGGVAGSQPMSTGVHRSPNKL
jgi:hypothetical protein